MATKKEKLPWGSDKTLAKIVNRLDCRTTMCCGISEVAGMNNLKSVADVMALRRVVGHSTNQAEFADEPHAVTEGGWGDNINTNLVLVTTTQHQKKAAKLLEAGGFAKLFEFVNENTQNTVTLWGAPTL